MKFHKLVIWAIALGCFPALAAAEGVVEERRAMAGDGTVTVINVAGEISISTWDQPEVKLVADLGNDQELKVSENSQGVRFEVVHVGFVNDHDEADLELLVPEGASVVAEGVSSDINIKGCKGKSLTAESVSGDVTVEAEVARADLSSVSGDVEFGGAAKRTTAESVSGDIELDGVSGEVSVTTVSGDAVMGAGLVERGQFETVSGTLQLHFAAADGGRVTVQSMSGDVVLTLPEGQSADFNAQTFSGDIESAWGEVAHESFGAGSHLKHAEGQGGAQIRVESFSGDVRIDHR
ncbi:MAG: DUF4097 family beta strand repeat protein [Xanthomonadales bacterium]|nr:DUF4097 domain-containing protein [Xanthomonadales bacterium]NIX11732.1 DUF4097 family beta strand repeat protein [Xanthomonadales bacterium]